MEPFSFFSFLSESLKIDTELCHALKKSWQIFYHQHTSTKQKENFGVKKSQSKHCQQQILIIKNHATAEKRWNKVTLPPCESFPVLLNN